MADKENILLFAKDFFGDAIDARLTFMQGEDVVHATDFVNGYTVVEMPSQLEPGVYDVVATRGNVEYRIPNLVVAMASHYFHHAQLHNDLRITGKNLKPGEKLESYKFNSLMHEHLTYLPDDAKTFFDKIAKYSSMPDSVRWGGQVILNDQVVISRGEAVIDGKLVKWPQTKIPLPKALGIYNIGVHDNKVVMKTTSIHHPMATLLVEAEDWIRIIVHTDYHPIERGTSRYFFTDFEETTNDVTMEMPSQEGIFGVVKQGKIYDRSMSSKAVKRVKLKVNKNGPVLATDRLYVYAHTDYFLLWEDATLLTALPREDNSYMELDWNDGLAFSSWGSKNQTRWDSLNPYPASFVTFRVGEAPEMVERDLEKVIEGYSVIAGNTSSDYTQVVDPTATLVW